MPLLSKSEVQDELAVFPDIANDPCYDDFVAISIFLAETPAVVKALGQLEKRIRDKAESAWRGSQEYQSRRQAYPALQIDLKNLDGLGESRLISHLTGTETGHKSSYLKHLVSSCMTDLEVAHGFNVSGSLWNQGAQYYLGVLDAEVFRDQIKAGRPPGKDPYVDVGHGEYTHRLQWCAVMAASDARDLRLRNPAITVYRALGSYAAPKGSYQSTFRWGLWDAICDRDNGTAAAVPFKAVQDTDFRCPNCLNGWLREDGWQHGLPLLGAFLTGRHAKRAKRPNPLDYAAKKVFAKARYDDLTPEQQKLVLDKIGSMRGVFDRTDGWRY